MINDRRNLTNCCNALKSTGPRSVAGKRASSQNSRKHGLNSAPDFESSSEYRALVDLIEEEGFSAFACADIASGLLNYRRVMDAYYDTYISPEPVDEFLRDVNVKASNLVFSELLSLSGSEVSPKMCERWHLFLPACKDRSGVRVGRYPVAPRTATS
jgi:hypothetical protein